MDKIVNKYLVKDGEKLVKDEIWVYDRDGQQGEVEIRVVVEDGGMADLKGMIKIAKQVKGIESFLRYKVLLLGERAIVNVTPQLEIESNEVKASHAASIGRVDEEQLFYLMSRGLSRPEAIELIVKAFLE